MQSFGLLLVVFSLCITFVPTNSLKCYKCMFTEDTCNNVSLASSMKADDCAKQRMTNIFEELGGGGPTDTPEEKTTKSSSPDPKTPTTPVAPVDPNAKYYCFYAIVKLNDTTKVHRGCKISDKTDNCVNFDPVMYPTAKVEKCTTCEKDLCNASSSMPLYASITVHFVLVSAMTMMIKI